MIKEKQAGSDEAAATEKHHMFKYGLLVCLSSGILNSLLNLAFLFGTPIADTARNYLSDGAVAPLLHDFIEMKVHVYNPVQPNVPGSDPQELKKKYGDAISFFGGIDQQGLLPNGDVNEIRAEINRRCQILGANGGYLLAPAHIIQADVAPETVKLMIEAAKEYAVH